MYQAVLYIRSKVCNYISPSLVGDGEIMILSQQLTWFEWSYHSVASSLEFLAISIFFSFKLSKASFHQRLEWVKKKRVSSLCSRFTEPTFY